VSLAEGPADDCLSLEAVVGADRAQLLLLGRCFGVVERHIWATLAGCYCTHAGWLQGQSHTHTVTPTAVCRRRTEQGSVNSDARHASCIRFSFLGDGIDGSRWDLPLSLRVGVERQEVGRLKNKLSSLLGEVVGAGAATYGPSFRALALVGR